MKYQVNSVNPHVIPNIDEWPIYLLSEDRKAFVNEIDAFTLKKLLHKDTEAVTDMIAQTVYLERIRIKEELWKVDPPKERQFWKRIQKQLVAHSLDRPAVEADKNNRELLQQIIHRYSEEIVGTFRIKTFLFARRFLTFFFNRLLNTRLRTFFRPRRARQELYEKLVVEGDLETIRKLMLEGTVVIVPTHFSNLDSILIGYALDAVVGLPSFSYGAGLNLYNTGYTAYFMNRLGAYRIDRRKKNPIYLETLKAMSKLSIERGTNNLFFPGGTRSRSGNLETKLKLGLLSTVVEAQRATYQKGENRKVFIVPLVLGYHFVLEAQFLIQQHLKRMGKERFIKSKDDFYSPLKVLRFAWKVLSEGNEIVLSFGRPMDVLGNPVDAKGKSYDQYGNEINLRSYFEYKGTVNADLQRESEYTRLLGERIVERYHKDNMVLSSHLVAFSAFQLLKQKNPRLDLYGVLRQPTEDYVFKPEQLTRVVEQVRDKLLRMEAEGAIKLIDVLKGDIQSIILEGIQRLGTFHLKKPLKFDKKGQIISENFYLLYYYHNRLENYQLDKVIEWEAEPIVEAMI